YRDRDSQLGLGPQHTVADTAHTQLSLGRRWWDERLHSVVSADYTDYSADDDYSALPVAQARRLSVASGTALEVGDGERQYNASLQWRWNRDEATAQSDQTDWQIEPAIGMTQRLGR